MVYARAELPNAQLTEPIPSQTQQPRTLSQRLAELDDARNAGLIGETEWATKRAQMLDRYE